jgi:hypothetical protein
MRALPPIPFSAGPAFIHALPTRTSGLVVLSSQGLINIADVSDPSAANEFYQVRNHCSSTFGPYSKMKYSWMFPLILPRLQYHQLQHIWHLEMLKAQSTSFLKMTATAHLTVSMDNLFHGLIHRPRYQT